MASDKLATLLRLRAIEERVAKAGLAESLAAQREAETRATTAEAALLAEAKGADPAHYAAWLPRGLMQRDTTRRAAAATDTAAEEARGILAAAHAARRVAEEAKARRDAEEEAALTRKTQHALDDLARQKLMR